MRVVCGGAARLGLCVPANCVVRSPRHRAHRVSGGLEKLAMYMNRRKRARVSESPWMAVAAGVEEEDADSGALVLGWWWKKEKWKAGRVVTMLWKGIAWKSTGGCSIYSRCKVGLSRNKHGGVFIAGDDSAATYFTCSFSPCA